MVSLLTGEVVLHLMPLIIHAGLRRLGDSGKSGIRGHRSGVRGGESGNIILVTRSGTTCNAAIIHAGQRRLEVREGSEVGDGDRA